MRWIFPGQVRLKLNRKTYAWKMELKETVQEEIRGLKRSPHLQAGRYHGYFCLAHNSPKDSSSLYSQKVKRTHTLGIWIPGQPALSRLTVWLGRLSSSHTRPQLTQRGRGHWKTAMESSHWGSGSSRQLAQNDELIPRCRGISDRTEKKKISRRIRERH